MKSAAYYIQKLGLIKHIEGGAYKETYRSDITIPRQVLNKQFHGDRNASTAIYFLLEYGQFSALHRIASDEVWHFYDGDPLFVYEICIDGKLITHKLGRDTEQGEAFQCVVKAGSWFGSRCQTAGGFSLVGCTVAPGFDFADFELAERNTLQSSFPQHSKIITELTAD
ncbi:MAG TPA: cupin domain-containing protein [Bacteroidia bacterium]